MFNKILGLFIITCFVGCTHKASDFSVETMQKTTIDESREVLMRLPSNLYFTGDSVIAAVNSRQKLSLYNLYSGKNLQNLSLDKFNFDSLIGATYRKKYDGIKTYVYNKGFELNGENYQLINYCHADNTFYVFVSLLAEVKDLKDSSAVVKMRNSEAAKELGDKIKNAEITVMDYVNFLFILDSNLHMKEIIPMYAEEGIRKKNYYAYFHKNFSVEKGYLYVPVATTSDNINLEAKMDAGKSNFAFAKINLHDQDDVQFIMNYNDLDFSDYRMQDYFDANCSYLVDNGQLLLCTGKEIINCENKQKLFTKNYLGKEEWVQNFYKKDDHLFLTTYINEHKQSVVISGHTCPIDSVTECHLKLFDMKEGKIVSDKKLPEAFVGVAMSENNIVYAIRDKKNYFFDYIHYHEK